MSHHYKINFTLKFRYKNALANHGHTHGRDEALFLMEFKSHNKTSIEKALKLASNNWENQKEPDDAIILLRASKFLKQAENEKNYEFFK